MQRKINKPQIYFPPTDMGGCPTLFFKTLFRVLLNRRAADAALANPRVWALVIALTDDALPITNQRTSLLLQPTTPPPRGVINSAGVRLPQEPLVSARS